MHKKKTSARLDLTKHKDGRDNVDIWRLIRNPLVNLIISIYIVTPKVKRQDAKEADFFSGCKIQRLCNNLGPRFAKSHNHADLSAFRGVGCGLLY